MSLLNIAPEIRNYLMTIADQANLKLFTEKRLRTITTIPDREQQIKKFREIYQKINAQNYARNIQLCSKMNGHYLWYFTLFEFS